MKKNVCLLLLLHSLLLVNAQRKITDSLLRLIETAKEDTDKVNLLYNLSDFYYDRQYNLDSATQYTNQGYELSKKINYLNGELGGLINISFYEAAYGKTELAKEAAYTGLNILDTSQPQDEVLRLKFYRRLGIIYRESNPDSSIYYSTKVLRMAQDLQLDSLEAQALGGMGYDLLFLGNYPEALRVTLHAVQIAKNIKDLSLEASMYRYLGNVYFFENDVRTSIRYYDTATFLAAKIKNINPDLIGSIGISKARAYLKLNVLDSALRYAQQCYEISKNDYDYTLMSRLLNIFGNIYEKLGKDSIAFSYFRQGIIYSLGHNSYTAAIQTYNSLAQYFYNRQKLDSSIFYANQAVELIQTSGVILDEPETYGILSNAYQAKRNLDSTFKYLGLMQRAKDSLLGKDKVEQMKLIEFDEEQQQVKQEAAGLAYKNKVKFYSLIAGIALLFIIVGLFWRSIQIKQKSYALLKKQQEETDFQRKVAEQTLEKLKATQSQLIQSEKMASLGELTAGIAHEIQNPLNFVNNFSEVNKELLAEMKDEIDKGNTEEVKDIVKNIIDNEEKINHHGKRADSIVKGMLQHSRSSTGIKEPTNINALADEYLRLAYHGLRAKDKLFNVTLQTELDESIRKVNLIPQDIGRVLLNLYNNSFYAVSEKKKQQPEGYEPTVSVSTKRINGKIEIMVIDNGNGIPQKVLDKIFQPFFTTKPTGQGTGLGLSLSYDIIKAHGGEIKVETGAGEFAKFIIELPAGTI